MAKKGQEAKRETREGTVNEFLGREYNSLVSLYVHHENTLSSIFNFYLTLLSTIVGAVIVVSQINSSNLSGALPILGFLLLFAIMLGIITQEALLSKNADLAHIVYAINTLKQLALNDAEAIKEHVFYLYSPFTEISPVEKPTALYAILSKRLWFLVMVGTHQLFISLLNSLALGFLVVVIIQAIVPGSVSPVRLVIGCLLVNVASYIAQSVYAHKEFDRRVRARKLRMSVIGKPPA